jgi:hypothetical protein
MQIAIRQDARVARFAFPVIRNAVAQARGEVPVEQL